MQGPFPKKMLRKGAFSGKHFDDDPAMSFKLFEEDALSKRIVSTPPPPPPFQKKNTSCPSFA